MNNADKFVQLRRGLLEFAVLKIISSKQVYAADILSALSTTDFATGEGTLYPLVSRLRREGLIDYQWIESETGPPRKYFGLTEAGKAQLADLQNYWSRIEQTIQNLGATSE